MRPSFKSLIGLLILMTFIVIYTFFAMVIGSAMTDRPMAVQIAYFAVAGVVWVVPAGLIIRWMARSNN